MNEKPNNVSRVVAPATFIQYACPPCFSALAPSRTGNKLGAEKTATVMSLRRGHSYDASVRGWTKRLRTLDAAGKSSLRAGPGAPAQLSNGSPRRRYPRRALVLALQPTPMRTPLLLGNLLSLPALCLTKPLRRRPRMLLLLNFWGRIPENTAVPLWIRPFRGHRRQCRGRR